MVGLRRKRSTRNVKKNETIVLQIFLNNSKIFAPKQTIELIDISKPADDLLLNSRRYVKDYPMYGVKTVKR